METKNRVEINIGKQHYVIMSEEPAEKIEALAAQIDERLKEMMADSRLSLTQALILVSLDLANNVQKQAELTEKYKSEIADYLNDAANAMSERDKFKRELDRLKGRQTDTFES